MLDLEDLRLLLALEEAGSLSAAARRLHRTPSALTHRLKALEGRLGVVLWARGARLQGPTAAGRRALAAAREVLPRLEALEAELGRLARGEGGRLHITVECHSCFEWLMPVLEALRERHPEVELDLSPGDAFDPLPRLRRGEVDLVLTSDPPEGEAGAGLRALPLFPYQALLAMAPGHPLAGRPWIEPADLAGETLLAYPVPRERLDVFRRFLDPAGVRPARVRPVGLTVLMLQLAASGRGVCALPSWALSDYLARGYVAARPLGREG
ncbi:MAG: LysR family transcriptional regulator, partial [Gammaproteobacteria bacterium]